MVQINPVPQSPQVALSMYLTSTQELLEQWLLVSMLCELVGLHTKNKSKKSNVSVIQIHSKTHAVTLKHADFMLHSQTVCSPN